MLLLLVLTVAGIALTFVLTYVLIGIFALVLYVAVFEVVILALIVGIVVIGFCIVSLMVVQSSQGQTVFARCDLG